LKDRYTQLPDEVLNEDDHTPYTNLPRAVPVGEVLIVQTSDAVWQEVVNIGLQLADLVIVDVTEPSANLVWELQAAARNVSAGDVVLIYAYRGTASDTVDDTMMGRLREAIGLDFLNSCHWLPYPEEVDGWRARRASERQFGNKLRNLMLEHAKHIPPRLHCGERSIRFCCK